MIPCSVTDQLERCGIINFCDRDRDSLNRVHGIGRYRGSHRAPKGKGVPELTQLSPETVPGTSIGIFHFLLPPAHLFLLVFILIDLVCHRVGVIRLNAPTDTRMFDTRLAWGCGPYSYYILRLAN